MIFFSLRPSSNGSVRRRFFLKPLARLQCKARDGSSASALKDAESGVGIITSFKLVYLLGS